MTSAAPLLNTPNSPPEWDQWTFQLDQNVRDILQAIRTQKGINIQQPQIFPLPANAVTQWLERVSAVIGQIAGILNVDASDVETVDLNDERERQAWSNQIFSEINAARGALKI